MNWTKYQCQEPQPNTKYNIEHLTDDTMYEMRAAAENRAGVGPWSEPSEPVRTRIVGDAPVLKEALKDVTVVAPQTAAFECAITVIWFRA